MVPGVSLIRFAGIRSHIGLMPGAVMGYMESKGANMPPYSPCNATRRLPVVRVVAQEARVPGGNTAGPDASLSRPRFAARKKTGLLSDVS